MPEVTGTLVTGANAHTLFFEGAEEVFPCRCGETHRGPYAHYDYWHHNCFHDEVLILEKLEGQEHPDMGVCTACGKPFRIVWPP